MSKRERDDEISKVMGSYLLKGYAMLDQYCHQCQNPMMKSRQGEMFCVACDEVDVKMKSEDKQAEKQSKRQELEKTSSPCHEKVKEECAACSCGFDSLDLLSSSNTSTNLDMKEDIEKAIVSVQMKLKWASSRLQSCHAVNCSIQLCSLIKLCSETLKSLKSLESVNTSKT